MLLLCYPYVVKTRQFFHKYWHPKYEWMVIYQSNLLQLLFCQQKYQDTKYHLYGDLVDHYQELLLLSYLLIYRRIQFRCLCLNREQHQGRRPYSRPILENCNVYMCLINIDHILQITLAIISSEAIDVLNF